jgi:aminoglycoside phosphotransferase family enzyme
MTIPPEQQDVAQFLTALAGAPPTETHISAVFIGTDTVWKLKKAVRMPFLDFTTLRARAHFLRRELDINKPAAVGLYRDVIAISRRDDGTLGFDDANPIDFVLRMGRVPEQDFLESIIARNSLGPGLLDALGDAVAAYHAGISPIRNVDGAALMLRITRGNACSAKAALLHGPDVETWKDRMEAAIEQHHRWLNTRSAEGYIRRCHGDLHLGNICLWQGKPVLFDALEFDEALATIDLG